MERKEEIRELWDIVNDFTQNLEGAEDGFFQKNPYLLVPGIKQQLTVIEFYEAIGISVIGNYTNAVSNQEVFRKFEEIARRRMSYEVEMEGLIPSHNDLLANLKPDYIPKDIEDLPIGDLYLLGSVLVRNLDPDMYCSEDEKKIFDGIRMATTLASYAIARFTPLVKRDQAKSIFTTMVDHFEKYWETVDHDPENLKPQMLENTKRAYQQINIIFGNS